ncbi:MFS transporter [Streptomyces sp. NPDC086554]|uniref:MFS transporter n=1 Tax=Streptomyces sp. NPDC086554 TaxID=3154864 RepID=UPI0034353477
MTHDAQDASRGTTLPAAEGRGRWLLVAVAGSLSFVAMLDMNVVNVSLSEISRDLRVSPSMAQWAALGYQLAVVSLLLPAGRWLDGRGTGAKIGLRPAILVSVTGFAVCGLLSAAAPWMAWLTVTRIAQGAFGSMLFVLMPVLAMRAVPPKLRARAMSVPATLGPLGAVTGPPVGGMLLDAFGWRAVFIVKLPVCIGALLVASRLLPRSGKLHAPGGRILADAALVGSGLAALLLSLSLASESPGWLLLGVAALPPLAWWLRGPGGRQVCDVVRASGTHRINTAVFAIAAGFASMHFVMALRLQREGGLSATATGLTMLSFPLAMGLMGPLGGRLADRYGPQASALAGSAITALGLALLLPLGNDSLTWGDIAWRLAIAGSGMGLYGGPVQTLVMSSAPPGAVGTAGSVVQLSRSLGFAVGPALATAVWGIAGAARSALVVSAAAACVAVLLLSLRRPVPEHEKPGADAAPAPSASR